MFHRVSFYPSTRAKTRVVQSFLKYLPILAEASMETLDLQSAWALTALAAALCKQPSIDGQRLRMDFLEALEGIAASPQGVGTVALQISSLMDAVLKAEHGKPSSPH